MSIRKKVSVKRAIDMSMEMLSIKERTQAIPLLTTWAGWAEDAIGSYNQYEKKNFVLDAALCKAELPCCVTAVLGLLTGDYGTDCNLAFDNLYKGGSAFIGVNKLLGFVVIDADWNVSSTSQSWNIQDNKIIGTPGCRAKKITIQALCYQVDCDDFIMINEEHIRAIAKFIEWQWMERQKHRKGETQYQNGEINRVAQEWSRLCTNCRADDGEPSPTERAEIAAMINDPLSGIANAVWVSQNSYYR